MQTRPGLLLWSRTSVMRCGARRVVLCCPCGGALRGVEHCVVTCSCHCSGRGARGTRGDLWKGHNSHTTHRNCSSHFTHPTALHTPHSTSHTPQYFTHPTVLHTPHSTSHITQYFTHPTVLHTPHSTSHTPQYFTHPTVLHKPHSTSHTPQSNSPAKLKQCPA